jgi:hypothetical protein
MSTLFKARRPIFLILCAIVILGAVAPARAAEVRPGQDVVIPAGEVIDDDLIVTGQTITIDGTVTGDLVAIGQSIILNGVVEGSAALAAQDVIINGDVNGSIYTGGYSLDLGETATAGRNLYFGGYSLNTSPGSEVARNAFVGAYQMAHHGRIGQDLMIGLSAFDLNGEVGGDVRGGVTVDPNAISPTVYMPQGVVPVVPVVPAVEPGLLIEDTAKVGGTIDVAKNVVTPVTAEPVEPVARGLPVVSGLPDWFTNRLGEFIGLLLVGAVIILLFPRFLPALGDELHNKPLPSFGWGLAIVFVLLPLALLVGLALVVLLTLFFGFVTFGEMIMSILAITSSFLGFAFVAYLFAVYVISKLVVSYWAGRFILSRANMNPASRWTHFGYLALGLLVFEVLRAIPIFGFVLTVVVMLFGLGVMLALLVDRRRGVVEPAPKPAIAAGV